MSEIETLTEEEREFLRCSWANFDDVGSDEATKMKALRIIDAQAKRIAELVTQVAELSGRIPPG